MAQINYYFLKKIKDDFHLLTQNSKKLTGIVQIRNNRREKNTTKIHGRKVTDSTCALISFNICLSIILFLSFKRTLDHVF